MMRKIYILVTLMLMSVISSMAQEVYTITGHYTYYCNDNDSKADGKKKAIQAARIQALSDKFGVAVDVTEILDMKETDGKVKENYLSLVSERVKGMWLGDEEKPKITVRTDENTGNYVIDAVVKGRVREIVKSLPDITASVLSHHDDNINKECLTFVSGDNFFLSFKAPVDGYVLVYLLDEYNNANRILPYKGLNSPSFKVKADKEYVFFSGDTAPAELRDVTDELNLYTDKDIETNKLLVIFSTNKLFKANDAEAGINPAFGCAQPRQLDVKVFRDYLKDMMVEDNDIQVISKVLTIKR